MSLFASFALPTIAAHAAPSNFTQPAVRVGGDVGRAAYLLRQPDGKLLTAINPQRTPVADMQGLWRFNADGSVDPSFGVGGFVQPADLRTASDIGSPVPVRGIALSADGRIFVVGQHGGPDAIQVIKLLPNGKRDTSFGNGGVAVRPGNSGFPVGIVVQPDGHVLVACEFAFEQPKIARFNADGTFEGDVVIPGFPASLRVFMQQPDGKLVVTGNVFGGPDDRLFWVARLNADATADASFGGQGLYTDGSGFVASAPATQADGRLLLAGSVLDMVDVPYPAVLRLRSDGQPDTSFGQTGLVALAFEPQTSGTASAVAVDSRRRIIVVTTVADNPGPGYPLPLPMERVGVTRLLADGSDDTTFAAHGHTLFWEEFASSGLSLVVAPDDEIVVGGSIETSASFFSGVISPSAGRTEYPALWFLRGGDSTRTYTASEARAVEFYHAGFDHYFISSAPNEIASLILSSRDWVPTGRTFKVWSEAPAGSSAVCRFFSDQSFAPRSSHFYTPYPDECQGLRNGTVWHSEGIAFYLQLPLGVPGTRTCRAGTSLLYRLYNNGQGGAPNHRYTDDLSVVTAMEQQGWVFEGEASSKVFSCIPDAS